MKKNEYDIYRYYKGQDKNPFGYDVQMWWELEKTHHERHPEKDFIEYLEGFLQKMVDNAGGTIESRRTQYMHAGDSGK